MKRAKKGAGIKMSFGVTLAPQLASAIDEAGIKRQALQTVFDKLLSETQTLMLSHMLAAHGPHDANHAMMQFLRKLSACLDGLRLPSDKARPHGQLRFRRDFDDYNISIKEDGSVTKLGMMPADMTSHETGSAEITSDMLATYLEELFRADRLPVHLLNKDWFYWLGHKADRIQKFVDLFTQVKHLMHANHF